MNHQNLECKWQKCETFLRRKERRQKKLIMRFEKIFHILKIKVKLILGGKRFSFLLMKYFFSFGKFLNDKFKEQQKMKKVIREKNYIFPFKKKISRPLYLLRYGVNLSILLTPGKEIKRDSASSGERRWNRSKEKGVLV